MSKPNNLPYRTHLRNHFIYYNLHKRCWSLKSLESFQPSPHDRVYNVATVKGRVTGHADTILAWDITTKISETGRQRVIREKRKNVHAGITCTGCIVGPTHSFVTTERTPTLAYNPYNRPDFCDRATGATVRNAPYVLLRADYGCPARVYYGDSLFYATWDDHDRFDGYVRTVGFIGKADLSYWIGYVKFTGTVYRNGLPYYVSRDGNIDYAEYAEYAATE